MAKSGTRVRARARRRTGAGTALAAALAATALLLTGCGGGGAATAEGKHRADLASDTSDDKAPGPGRTPPAAPSASADPSPTALPEETSVPDPALPPPVVSMDIAHAAEGGGRAVAVTLDDGPDPTWTPKVLKVLADNHVRATFCMIGPQAAAHPALVRRVVGEGHRLCDHSVDHDEAMDHRSRGYQRRQVLRARDQITAASGGVAPLYYRAPGGAFTPYSRQVAAAAGLRPLGWNVDSADWERPGAAAIRATVEDELGNGPTLLFHDGGGDRSQTVAALRTLLPWLRHHGYRFVFPER